ncbi:MAG: hypothetical protein C0594_09410 [Marinilabiliales bacterium]|nr:MAG: hypothetical protein C0594_09410 [Marinilabiliales bacterium]
MSSEFNKRGLKATSLVSGGSDNNVERDKIKQSLESGAINCVFVRDIYNEGVDIPSINTVLFLRPTESLTIYLQQLGRGLRLEEGKECLTVLDFVSQANQKYNYTEKIRALVGRTSKTITEEIEEGFPHVPFGCSIKMEKLAAKYILSNIKDAIYDARRIQSALRLFLSDGNDVSLFKFLQDNEMDIKEIYKGNNNWISHLQKIDRLPQNNDEHYIHLTKSTKRLLHINSRSYLNFIESLFNSNIIALSNEVQQQYLMMFYYDIWQKPVSEWGFDSIEESIDEIKNYPQIVEEILCICKYLKAKIDVSTAVFDSDFPIALELHAKYIRDEVLASFGCHEEDKKSSSREGVLQIKEKNTELLFVTLDKSDKSFSPTTAYEDYAISEKIFHWQSQNATAPHSKVGLSYIKHKEKGKLILLFVRERTKDDYGFTMPFHFLGPVNYLSHRGSKPMSIKWELENELPASLWEYAGKMAHG